MFELGVGTRPDKSVPLEYAVPPVTTIIVEVAKIVEDKGITPLAPLAPPPLPPPPEPDCSVEFVEFVTVVEL